jgi:Tol biopolymer transport system component
MLKRNVRVTVIFIFLLFLAVACNNPTNNAGPLSQPVIVIKERTRTSISGKVEFPAPGKFSAKSTAADISAKATVSLIDPATNITIATGLTDNTGTFMVNPEPAFVPTDNQIFILEASKRPGDVGSFLIAIRTLVKWNANTTSWSSITTGIVKINSKTTALSVISGLNPGSVNPADLIGTVDSNTGSFSPPASVPSGTLTAVDNLVNQILADNRDPVKLITLNGSVYTVANPPKIIKPLGSSIFYLIPSAVPSCPGAFTKRSINVMDIDGNNKRELVPLTTSLATINSVILTGGRTMVVYRLSGNGITSCGGVIAPIGIFSAPVDGGSPVNLSGDLTTTTGISNLANAPDLSKFAFAILSDASSKGIYVSDGTLRSRKKVTGSSSLTSFVLSTGTAFYSTWSPDSSKIAFTASNGTKTDVYIVDAAGNSSPINVSGTVTASGKNADSPMWSPDGTKLVFKLTDTNRTDLYYVSVNGNSVGSPVNMSQGIGIQNGASTEYRFSPDLTKIAWFSKVSTSPQEFDLYIYNFNNSTVKNMTGNVACFDNSPATIIWPANSSRVLTKCRVTSGGRTDIYVSDPETVNSAVNVTGSIVGVGANSAVFSRDGSKVIFTSIETVGTFGFNKNYVTNSNGSGTPTKLTDGNADSIINFGSVVFHPTGDKFLLGYSTLTAVINLIIINDDGTSLINTGIAYNSNTSPLQPQWFKDGSRILFFKSNDIWTMNPSGGDQKNLTNSTAIEDSFPTVYLK